MNMKHWFTNRVRASLARSVRFVKAMRTQPFGSVEQPDVSGMAFLRMQL
jgi:hypothetical protein